MNLECDSVSLEATLWLCLMNLAERAPKTTQDYRRVCHFHYDSLGTLSGSL